MVNFFPIEAYEILKKNFCIKIVYKNNILASYLGFTKINFLVLPGTFFEVCEVGYVYTRQVD